MKRDMDTPITSVSGAKFAIGERVIGYKGDGDKGEPIKETIFLTLGMVAITALTGVFEEEGRVAGAEKVRRMALALKIQAGGVMDCLSEDIVLLKRLIDLCYPSPEIVARAWEILDKDYDN